MERIGKFTIEREVGRGGMGIVYRGRDPDIERTVAIKTLHFAGAVGEEEQEKSRKRFLREARSAGNLSHPNIVTIYEVGRDRDMAFIAMEFVEGCSLESRLSSCQRLSPEDALALLAPLAEALDYAHGQGVVHRDLKPANILIDGAGQPHLVDFGIARITTSATQTQTVMGTPFYMSPEQIAGRPSDHRSDLYSLAVVAYEMLTGAKPFPGENITTVIYRIMNEAPPPLAGLNPDLSPGLDAVLRRALDKSPEARFASGGELVQALRNPHLYCAPPVRDAAAAAPAGTAVPTPVQADIPRTPDPRRRLLLLTIGMMAALVIVLVVAWLAIRGPSSSKGGTIALSTPAPERQAAPEADTPASEGRDTDRGSDDIERPGDESVGTDPAPPPGRSRARFEDEAEEHYRARRLERMKAVSDEGLKLYPESADLWSYQAMYYFMTESAPQRADKALRAARRAAQLEPERPVHHVNLGWIQQELFQDYTSALAAYRQGEAYAEDRPSLIYHMGFCLEKLFRLDEAAAEYRRFLAAEPFDAMASRALARLARFKDSDPFVDVEWRESPVVWENEAYVTILIDRRSFLTYPAAMISLDLGKLVKLPSSPDALSGMRVEADLWIEPGDPEIAALTSGFAGMVHVGRDAAVAVVAKDDFSSNDPGGEAWERRISADRIEPGLVFRVRTSRGRIFKLRVDDLRQPDSALVLSLRVLSGGDGGFGEDS